MSKDWPLQVGFLLRSHGFGGDTVVIAAETLPEGDRREAEEGLGISEPFARCHLCVDQMLQRVRGWEGERGKD